MIKGGILKLIQKPSRISITIEIKNISYISITISISKIISESSINIDSTIGMDIRTDISIGTGIVFLLPYHIFLMKISACSLIIIC